MFCATGAGKFHGGAEEVSKGTTRGKDKIAVIYKLEASPSYYHLMLTEKITNVAHNYDVISYVAKLVM